MSPRTSSFSAQRLTTRFRWAAFLLLLPLLGLAAVSGFGLAVTSSASGALDRARTLTAQTDVLDEHVQAYAISALVVLIGPPAADDLATLAAAQNQVDSDLARLSSSQGLVPEQLTALATTQAAWNASAGDRAAVKGFASTSAAGAAAALEDRVGADVTTITSHLATLDRAGEANVAGLQQERDAAVRTSAIVVVIALVLGILNAVWLSRRLGLSILRPLRVLARATEGLAAGDLGHRVSVEGSDEIAELGASFNVMAGQLEGQHHAVRERERRLTALVENASDGIMVIGADGAIAFVTPSFREYVDGVGASTQLVEIVHPDDRERVRSAWLRALNGGDGTTLEIETRLKRRHGDWRHVWAKLTNRFGDAAVAGMVVNLSDVSERHEHEQQLTFQAMHDALTGLANRELFRQRLERSVLAVESAPIDSVLYVDLDDFKRVNDTLGHRAGDEFLMALADRLVASVRPSDIVARLGGDEFAILLEGADTRAAVAAAERALTSLQKPLTIAGKVIIPRASVGIASAAHGTASPDTLLADADLAMYFAKRQGKSQYQVFSPAMRSDLLDRLQLGEDLRAAIDAGGIEVHYQPIVDMQSGSIVGAEALARWRHPTRGPVGPIVFIPLAEELGLAGRIDAAVLREACTQGCAWVAAGLPAMRMAVNLSGTNLDDPDLVATVRATLAQTGFPPALLELELTEGVVIAESDVVLATLENLKALGLHLAIDDFGTGYSALSRLKALPFDTLKVDKVFVDELVASNPGSTLAESILDMARVLRLKVVAEGVETSTQADFLRRHGCDFAQGYLFSRPVDPAAFAELLALGHGPRVLEVEAALLQ